MDIKLSLKTSDIENRILIIRNQQVMIDRDLAELYGVETKALNQAVKRNIGRFPIRFRFQLTENETNELVTNCDRLTILKHSTTLPHAFTQQGVAMLASVLTSNTAIEVSVRIMDAFVAMRSFLMNNSPLFSEIYAIKKHLNEIDLHQLDNDKKIERLFSIIDHYQLEEKQGIFFQGQVFDAYAKFEAFIQSAKKEIILIDQYVDFSVLERLTKKHKGVIVTLYTSPKTTLTTQDIQRFNAQYPTLTIHHSTTIHDRFLIIDGTTLYHIGASLKDLGKKCFAFETMEDAAKLIPMIIENA